MPFDEKGMYVGVHLKYTTSGLPQVTSAAQQAAGQVYATVSGYSQKLQGMAAQGPRTSGGGAGRGGDAGGGGGGGGDGGGGGGGGKHSDSDYRAAIKDMVAAAEWSAGLARRIGQNWEGVLDEQVKLRMALAEQRRAFTRKFDIRTTEGAARTKELAQTSVAERQQALAQRAYEAQELLGTPSKTIASAVMKGGVQREAAVKVLESKKQREIVIAQTELDLAEGSAKSMARQKVLRDELNREIAKEVRAQQNITEIAKENVAKQRDRLTQRAATREQETPADRAQVAQDKVDEAARRRAINEDVRAKEDVKGIARDRVQQAAQDRAIDASVRAQESVGAIAQDNAGVARQRVRQERENLKAITDRDRQQRAILERESRGSKATQDLENQARMRTRLGEQIIRKEAKAAAGATLEDAAKRQAYLKQFDVKTKAGREATGTLATTAVGEREQAMAQRNMEIEQTLASGGAARIAHAKALEATLAREVSIEQSKIDLASGAASSMAKEKVQRDELNRQVAAQVRAQQDVAAIAKENVAKERDRLGQRAATRKAETPADRAAIAQDKVDEAARQRDIASRVRSQQDVGAIAQENAAIARQRIRQQRADIAARTPADVKGEAVFAVEKKLAAAQARLAEQIEFRSAAGQRLGLQEQTLATETAELQAVKAQMRATDQKLIAAEGAEARAREEQAARVSIARYGGNAGNLQGAELTAQAAVLQRAHADRERAAIARQTGAEEREAAAQRKLEEAKLRSAIRVRERELIKESVASGDVGAGNWFQKLQFRMRPSQSKLPEEYLGLKQFMGEKAMTTVGFAASGLLLGGGMAAISEMFKDASELEQTFIRLRGQMEGIGKSESFGAVREQIKAVAADTGQASNQVAIFYARMLGLSGDPAAALADTSAAMRLATVTGLDMTTMMQSLVPIQKAFEISAEQIGDEVVVMGEKFGIAEDDLVQFLGKTASVAKNAGLNFKELTTIGATVANSLGKPISSSSEAINKSFGQIEANADKIFQILQANPATQGAIPKMIESMGKGETGAALIELLRASQNFEPGQRNAILRNVVSKREAEEFNALISNAGSILEQLEQQESGASDSTGKLNQRFGDLKTTVATTFKSLAAAFESIGDALFQTGIADFLVDLGRLLGTVVAAAGAVVRIFGALNGVFAPFGVPLLSTLMKIAAVSAVLIKVGDIVIDQKTKRAAGSQKELSSEKANEQQTRSSANTTMHFSGTKQSSMAASMRESQAEAENTAVKRGLTHAAAETAAAETGLVRAKEASTAASQAALLRGVGPGGPLVVPGGGAGGGPGGGPGVGLLGQYGGALALGMGGRRANIGLSRLAGAGGLEAAARGGLVRQALPGIVSPRVPIGPATYARQMAGWGTHAPIPPLMLTAAQRAVAIPVTEALTRGAQEAARTSRSRFWGDAGGTFRAGGSGRYVDLGTKLDYGAEAYLRARRIGLSTTELAPGMASRLAQRRLLGYDLQRQIADKHFAGRMAAGETVTSGLGTRAIAGGGLFGRTFKSAKADAQIAASGDKALGASPFAVGAIVAAGVMAVQNAYEEQEKNVHTASDYMRTQLRKADAKQLKAIAEQRASLWTTMAGALFDMPTEVDVAKTESLFLETSDARKRLGFQVRPGTTDMDKTKAAITERNKTVYKQFWETYSQETREGLINDLNSTAEGRHELAKAGILKRKLPEVDIVPKLEGFLGGATRFGIPGGLKVIQDNYNKIGEQVGTELNTNADGYAQLMLNLRGQNDDVSSRAAATIDAWTQGGMKESDRPDFDRMAAELAHSGNIVGAIEASGGNVEMVMTTLTKSGQDEFRSLEELAKLYQAGKITAAEYSTEAEKALGYVRLEARDFQGEMATKAKGVVLDTNVAMADAMLKSRQMAENVTMAFAGRHTIRPKEANRASLERLLGGAGRQTRLDNLQTFVQADIEAADEAIASVFDPVERTKAFAAGVRLDNTAYQTRLQAEMGSSTEVDSAIGEIAKILDVDKDVVSNEITKRAATTGKSLSEATNDWLTEKIYATPMTAKGAFTAGALQRARTPLLAAIGKIPDIRTDLPEPDKVALKGIQDQASARTAEAKVAATRFQGDDLRTAAQNTTLAYEAWQDLLKAAVIPGSQVTKEMVQEGEAAYLGARRSESDANFGYQQLVRNRQVVLAKGDPEKQVAAQLKVAQAELAEGRRYGNKSRIEKSEQDMLQLGQQQEEIALNIIRGHMQIAAALVSEDPRAAAIEALKQAEFELANAQGTADRESKNAAVIQAQKQLNNAISAGMTADAQLAITMASLRGDTVAAAGAAAQEAKRLLDEAIAKNITDRTVLAPLEASIAEANKQLYLAPIQKQLSDLDYLYGMEQISLGDYIAMLETQLSALVYDSQEYRDLNQKIFNLKKGASADLGWSVPGQLTLPTLYETRRASQTIFTPGGGAYQDNRNITVSIAIDGAQDPILVAQQVQTALNDSLRGGQTYAAAIPVAAGM